ncbi:hypothetical protein FS842_010721 [Serendipita sp. 407]|nr:hypothetical protein FS842_010721 [Serendipita sp. 407]
MPKTITHNSSGTCIFGRTKILWRRPKISFLKPSSHRHVEHHRNGLEDRLLFPNNGTMETLQRCTISVPKSSPSCAVQGADIELFRTPRARFFVTRLPPTPGLLLW